MHEAVPLHEELTAFIASRISVQVAACDDRGGTSLVRGLGARVTPDRQRVTVLVARSQADTLLRMIQSTARIAVVFSQPVTHRTVQLKGRDAILEAATSGDEAELHPYAQAMANHLEVYDVSEPFARALVSCQPGDLVAVTFTPCAAYGQTPGPGAGEQLPRGSAGQ